MMSEGKVAAISDEWRTQNAERRTKKKAVSQFFILHSAFGIHVPHSTNVTLLISLRVVRPSITFFSADSRRKVIPSSFAAFLISEAGRPSNPVPLHSRQPFPSQKVLFR